MLTKTRNHIMYLFILIDLYTIYLTDARRSLESPISINKRIEQNVITDDKPNNLTFDHLFSSILL